MQILAKKIGAGRRIRYFLRNHSTLSPKLAPMIPDRIDYAILNELQRDGRISNTALADRVGLSQSACSRRMDILEREGVILGYHARISNAVLGHGIIVIVHISLSGQSEAALNDFESAVKDCPNVLFCYLMSGEYDYVLRVAARDLADYERIHKSWLSSLPHVTRINSSFALREVVGHRRAELI